MKISTELPGVVHGDPDSRAAWAAMETERRRRLRRQRAGKALRTVLAVVISVVLIFPLYWMVVVAFSSRADLLGGALSVWPRTLTVDNFRSVFSSFPVATWFGNSVAIALVVALISVTVSTLAGYAFAQLRFRGSTALFLVSLATLTIPPTLSIVPLYVVMSKLGLVNNLASVILPAAVTAFGVFFMRQFIGQSIPDELIEAARVDGATLTRTVFAIVLPIVRPGMAVLGILSFMASWNDFLWPFIVVRDHPTVQVAVASISTSTSPDISVILAGTVIATLPLIIVTAVFGRQIVGGIIAGAVKG